jgi:hypothetical protein
LVFARAICSSSAARALMTSHAFMTSNATHTNTTNKVVPKMTRLLCVSVFLASVVASPAAARALDESGAVAGGAEGGVFVIKGPDSQRTSSVAFRLDARAVNSSSHQRPAAGVSLFPDPAAFWPWRAQKAAAQRLIVKRYLMNDFN